MDYDQKIEVVSAARLAAFRSMGDVSEYVLAPIIGPALTGGPRWPTRPAWRTIHRGPNIVLASDSLSDPWDDDDRETMGDRAGYELEVFMEAPAALLGSTATFTDIAGTWLFSAVSEVSNVVAAHGKARALLDEVGTVSVEVDGERFPPALRSVNGTVGILVGMAAAGVPEHIDYGPLGNARFVALTVLTPHELGRIVEEGDRTRTAIAEALAKSPTGHVSLLDRSSV